MDKFQMTDAFIKTIRQSIQENMTKWENRAESQEISGDIWVTAFARDLGLLPIPPMIIDLMNRNSEESWSNFSNTNNYKKTND